MHTTRNWMGAFLSATLLLAACAPAATPTTAPVATDVPAQPTEAEVAYWVEQFAASLDEPEAAAPQPPARKPAKQPHPKRRPAADPSAKPPMASPIDPFPPGYGDDLFDDAASDI